MKEFDDSFIEEKRSSFYSGLFKEANSLFNKDKSEKYKDTYLTEDIHRALSKSSLSEFEEKEIESPIDIEKFKGNTAFHSEAEIVSPIVFNLMKINNVMEQFTYKGEKVLC